MAQAKSAWAVFSLSLGQCLKRLEYGGISSKAPNLRFPTNRLGTIEMIQVACLELPDQPVQCLLGRDILSHWLFTYNGKTGEWRIDEEDVASWIEPPEGALT
jgi:hypothetical protein